MRITSNDGNMTIDEDELKRLFEEKVLPIHPNCPNGHKWDQTKISTGLKPNKEKNGVERFLIIYCKGNEIFHVEPDGSIEQISVVKLSEIIA